MAAAIADTSGLVALVRADDTTHPAALAAAATLHRHATPILVPTEVFAETINLLGKKVSSAVAVQAARSMLGNPTFTVAGSDHAVLSAATDLLEQQKASVSFVDALVMAWADSHGTRLIFGFDLAFTQNGYETPDNPHSRRAA